MSKTIIRLSKKNNAYKIINFCLGGIILIGALVLFFKESWTNADKVVIVCNFIAGLGFIYQGVTSKYGEISLSNVNDKLQIQWTTLNKHKFKNEDIESIYISNLKLQIKTTKRVKEFGILSLSNKEKQLIQSFFTHHYNDKLQIAN